MASGIFAILDDISILMDDIATLSKVATKKTAGILGDDLAVNAEKATGFVSSRELPVLWAITKGSFINKLIILPLVFLLSYYYPVLITYILITGGLYLAYEGMHNISDFLKSKISKSSQPEIKDIADVEEMNEDTKIKTAVRTDFILSLEIVIIALSTVLDKSLTIQIITVSIVAIIATVGVYGIVALIVRMDDLGLYLVNTSNQKSLQTRFGNFLIQLLPKIIRLLSVIGTIALLLVSGGIFLHHHLYFPEIFKQMPLLIQEFISDVMYGTIVMAAILVVKGILKIIKK